MDNSTDAFAMLAISVQLDATNRLQICNFEPTDLQPLKEGSVEFLS